MKLFAISGRRHGDDDDSTQFIWANDEPAATLAFQSSFMREDEAYTEDLVYVVSTQEVGAIVNGHFVLNHELDLGRYSGDGFDNSFKITHGNLVRGVDYDQLKDQPASSVWTIVPDAYDRRHYVVRAGWHTPENVVGYVATARPWDTGDEVFPW